jgi:hypothetical protein
MSRICLNILNSLLYKSPVCHQNNFHAVICANMSRICPNILKFLLYKFLLCHHVPNMSYCVFNMTLICPEMSLICPGELHPFWERAAAERSGCCLARRLWQRFSTVCAPENLARISSMCIYIYIPVCVYIYVCVCIDM